MDLSLRWVQPIQQQGRRMPLRILLRPTAICFSLVASCFTLITQQIHSLRARGVMSSHKAKTLGSKDKAFFKSGGSVWTVPEEIFLADVRILFDCYFSKEFASLLKILLTAPLFCLFRKSSITSSS